MESKHVEPLIQALEKVMEEGLRTCEIKKNNQLVDLASLFLSSYYGLRVLNATMQNRALSAL